MKRNRRIIGKRPCSGGKQLKHKLHKKDQQHTSPVKQTTSFLPCSRAIFPKVNTKQIHKHKPQGIIAKTVCRKPYRTDALDQTADDKKEEHDRLKGLLFHMLHCQIAERHQKKQKKITGGKPVSLGFNGKKILYQSINPLFACLCRYRKNSKHQRDQQAVKPDPKQKGSCFLRPWLSICPKIAADQHINIHCYDAQ